MTTSQKLPQDLIRQDKGPTVLAVCITLTAVATVFVAARLYVRGRILSRVGLDDWLIVLSMASASSATFSVAQHADGWNRFLATSCLA